MLSENISSYYNKLFLEDQLLNDRSIVWQHDIQHYSKLNLVASDIEIVVLINTEKLKVSVKYFETIKTVKAIIADKKFIPIARQELMFEKKKLDNSYTLDKYGITNGSLLTMMSDLNYLDSIIAAKS